MKLWEAVQAEAEASNHAYCSGSGVDEQAWCGWKGNSVRTWSDTDCTNCLREAFKIYSEQKDPRLAAVINKWSRQGCLKRYGPLEVDKP